MDLKQSDIYFSQIFDPLTLNQAKEIVLTSDPNNPNKFNQETSFLINFIIKNSFITKNDKVLDFGCGMGRIAKKLIEDIGCNVIGLDTSLHMQIHAMTYVNNDKFDTVTNYSNNDINVVIASLVLQHTKNPEIEIDTIYNILSQKGILIVINEHNRYVPIGIDNNGFVKWYDDKINIMDLLSKKFVCIGTYDYPNTNQKPLSVWTKLN
jgi:SAM-dependent methyltransferase